jgi:hypothetical protein
MNSCKQCRWWSPIRDEGIGHCRAMPPRVVVVEHEGEGMSPVAKTVFPRTTETEWCGWLAPHTLPELEDEKGS